MLELAPDDSLDAGSGQSVGIDELLGEAAEVVGSGERALEEVEQARALNREQTGGLDTRTLEEWLRNPQPVFIGVCLIQLVKGFYDFGRAAPVDV